MAESDGIVAEIGGNRIKSGFSNAKIVLESNKKGKTWLKKLSDSSDEDEDDDDDDDDDGSGGGGHLQAGIEGYDPSEFQHLKVSIDMRDLFSYIQKYSPQIVELDYKLKPFIPEYIPAVGDIDAFIKIPRPDGVSDTLGLTVLDEPCADQSDPAILQIQLRAASKAASANGVVVKKVENATKNYKAVEKWIKDIDNVHKGKHSSTYNYENEMPDVDELMQAWEPEFEEQLAVGDIPKDLDCDLLTYVDVICALFDIPVYGSRIDSLHLLFTLYAAVRNYQNRELLEKQR